MTLIRAIESTCAPGGGRTNGRAATHFQQQKHLPVVAKVGLLKVANVQRVFVALGEHGPAVVGIQEERVLVPQHLCVGRNKMWGK